MKFIFNQYLWLFVLSALIVFAARFTFAAEIEMRSTKDGIVKKMPIDKKSPPAITTKFKDGVKLMAKNSAVNITSNGSSQMEDQSFTSNFTSGVGLAESPKDYADTNNVLNLDGSKNQAVQPDSFVTTTNKATLLAELSADVVHSLEVVVNGYKSGTWPLVEHNGALYASREAFETWRVPLSRQAQSIQFKGQDYWPLASVLGYQSWVDFVNQSLELMFSPEAFAPTRLTQEIQKKLVVSPTLPSVFFNYDLNYTRNKLRGASTIQGLGVIGEVGASSSLGILTSSALAKNITNESALGTPRSYLRLESTFTRDFPDNNRTLRLGDTVTRTGTLGQAVYFGGVQYGTNFALNPGIAQRPIPMLKGISTTTSTVELYVNDVLRQVSDVPAGPFSIENLPTLTGSGEARLVVRDLLGRETVITQSFLSSNSLLANGLDDWSVEAGSIRRYLGTASANYGPAFTRALWRHGYSEKITLEGLTELTPAQRIMGLGFTSALPGYWLGKMDFSVSDEQSLGRGSKWLLGMERQGLHSYAFLQVQGATSNYRQLGQDVGSKPTKLQLAGNWSCTSDRFGTLGFGFVSISSFDQPHINTMSVNYSMQVGERGTLSLNASRSTGGFEGSSMGLNLVLPLDNDRMLSASANKNGKMNDFQLTATQSPTQDNNLGWSVQAGQQQNHQHERGSMVYLGQHGNLTGDVSSSPDQTALRLNASGGLVMADKHFFATQRLNQSFALAEVAGYGNVGVGLGNNVLAKTDASGVALIPQLVPYQSNSVRLDPKDLPVSAEIDSIEQIAVPANRSVVKVTFPVRSGRGALLKIRLDDGDVAPAGAIVQIEGDKDKREFYVARRGEAFVTGLQASNRLQLNWNDQQCKFDVALQAENLNEILRVGPLLCNGVVR